MGIYIFRYRKVANTSLPIRWALNLDNRIEVITMAKKIPKSNSGIDISDYQIEPLARCLLPHIQRYMRAQRVKPDLAKYRAKKSSQVKIDNKGSQPHEGAHIQIFRMCAPCFIQCLSDMIKTTATQHKRPEVLTRNDAKRHNANKVRSTASTSGHVGPK